MEQHFAGSHNLVTTPVYVTSADMEGLYDRELLVEATNYSDRTADYINVEVLQSACDSANSMASGYLLRLSIDPDKYTDAFKLALKTHSARLAIDVLASTDPQIREQAKESIDWLKNISRLSKEAQDNLIVKEADEPTLSGVVLPVLSFDEGRRWEVSW